MKGPQLDYADLSWSDSGAPISNAYGDIYFSKESGPEETDYVFLTGNRLRERFSRAQPGANFTIAETGFGSGLNFLMAWALWRECGPADGHLHFTSVEFCPLALEDLARCHQAWPQLAEFARQLQAQYPAPMRGVHRCRFIDQGVTLTLYLGDVVDWLTDCSFKADAWFLDGFSPKQNPEMWSESLFPLIASHAAQGCTVATFSAAGFIRRGLKEHGFNVSKAPGFGYKRDMTVGVFQAEEPSQPTALPCKEAVVIGSGLSGANVANALATRGWKVTVLEAGDQVAPDASGNPQGALYIKPGVEWSINTRIHANAFLYAERFYSQIANLPAPIWNPCGVLQLAHNDKEAIRQQKFFQHNRYPDRVIRPLSQQEASELAGVSLPASAMHLPGGGWLIPPQLCAHLLQHPDIEVRLNSPVSALERANESDWRIHIGSGESAQELECATVILATANNQAMRPTAASALPLKPIRGQVTTLQVEPAALPQLNTVLCGEGYLMPPIENRLVTGATFKPNCADAQVTEADNDANLEQLFQLTPALRDELAQNPPPLQGRASVRSALPDYLPAIGPFIPEQGEKGLLIVTAMGSKGLALAPLAGELIADRLEGTPAPIEDSLIQRVLPTRFSQE
ncbi:bifunctional tRNA (5-methylaminomethyl-2-thiouridine)(34)-methyltransferase MnmD/FAD-dependent 5-carboxymethylaminomethyl-2-thiouridine(34) oxidoreductase MnmC [Hahella sp. KA22]|uniref:bifunctional tRNA (5-methylaminomethyl-2-thiouridine)(34)-methyltransferase MnmD/FAD-dependent 5-carboxymethylaminomethyl-2-thiouridine(34) oxidoreductase MnmC n=1 Tax=Hahella sp. KA22 TaxID=1628392 RepID=UPI000FDDD27B|nr:bifunctional tRNA (5-methylaminomethyl-2-thiouridine)(34)-methyltransferase MnmD/FAD-dependent 5-carboxymethylaminomethyl-2-thiouridine(34) oxidoreductase MnmC [Hahella sp. KA22]AZZ91374.1 bifunctional tRNA (5-methylaminomethyl-2-thiouridine)(34)-methyltransferase MnmD/FAD-dependent 5-carboxymethylaminomethyl-2-thiouridine(34) oxidoreductase MnmC [Hahella sp. KA22]QAY54744.1 bifunctional tRNA (5-methylaminomethyl-2-thiouridine)(34)-methyltransferase MnmD/FAD-dependent 5-carboxymethylaminomethy